jgi:hypothetical protein
MITLTREEAQQVLDALYSMSGTEFLCQAAHHPKKDMHKSGEVCPVAARYMEARETLRARLSAPEPDIVQDAIVYGTGITKDGKRIAPDSIYKEPEPEPVRLRRGDTLRCIETNELCTVWATSTTGKTQVKWKANDFGSYTAEQIGDLFWVEPKPEPEPVAWMNESDIGKTDWKVWAHGKPTATMPLYATPPQPEPPCKTGSQCIGNKCPQCVVSEPEPVAYMDSKGNLYNSTTHPENYTPLYKLKEKNT